jgi:lipopolysaccharide biosynthesis regulator YciM
MNDLHVSGLKTVDQYECMTCGYRSLSVHFYRPSGQLWVLA